MVYFLNELVDLLGYTGLSRTSSLILAVLINEKNYISLTDLSRKTGYAKSHLSMYLKTLVLLNLVDRKHIGRKILFGINRNGLINYLKNYLINLRELLRFSSKNITDNELRSFLEKMYHKLNCVLNELEG